MSNFMDGIKSTLNNECNVSVTENGAVGFRTTGKALLDLNFAVASLRSASEHDISQRFTKAFFEDKLMAIKWLFYDIAGTSNIVNLAHRTIGLRRVTDAERENAAKYSEKRRQLLKYDVIVTIVKDRMFGRQNIDVGLYYDPASRRFFSDMDEYDRRFSWDKKEYKEPLPLPPQLLAEERASEDEAFGAVNDREG